MTLRDCFLDKSMTAMQVQRPIKSYYPPDRMETPYVIPRKHQMLTQPVDLNYRLPNTLGTNDSPFREHCMAKLTSFKSHIGETITDHQKVIQVVQN